jgi:hypothetical protein
LAVADQVTISGRRAEVLAYVAEHLDYLDGVAERTGTARPSQEQMPRARVEHLEALLKITRESTLRNDCPSPHYLRALAAQSCAWLEELRDRGEVSW